MSENTNPFEQASRNKLRFSTTQGTLDVEDLWDLPLNSERRANLNDIARELSKEIRNADTEDFVGTTSSKANTTTKLKFDVVLHVITVRKAENDAAQQATQKASQKARIREILAKKQDSELEGKSADELEQLLAGM